MADRRRAYQDNADGAVFVDDSCIHCGTCFHFAPAVFADAGEHSRVHRQPGHPDQAEQAALAAVACPTASIGGAGRSGGDGFPVPWTADVRFCGWTSPKSFGAWSWLIERPAGNVLVDSPRAAGPLLDRLEALGGIALQVLTHIDDVADHQAIHDRFACDRLIHRTEGLDVERVVDGGDPVALADDLLLIPTPGHTRGSCCLLFEERVLFTGDTLWWNERFRSLSASKTYCWHDWERQLASLASLLAYPFREVLPGHGMAHRREDATAMHDDLQRALDRLRRI